MWDEPDLNIHQCLLGWCLQWSSSLGLTLVLGTRLVTFLTSTSGLVNIEVKLKTLLQSIRYMLDLQIVTNQVLEADINLRLQELCQHYPYCSGKQDSNDSLSQPRLWQNKADKNRTEPREVILQVKCNNHACFITGNSKGHHSLLSGCTNSFFFTCSCIQ